MSRASQRNQSELIGILCAFACASLGCAGKVVDAPSHGEVANVGGKANASSGVATGGKVDLGSPVYAIAPTLDWERSAQVAQGKAHFLINGAIRIGGITVDDGRLYWLSDGADGNGECRPNQDLSSCDPNDCEATVTSVVRNPAGSSPGSTAPLRVGSGVAYFPGTERWVSSCSVSGCASPSDFFDRGILLDYVVTSDEAYFLTDVILRCNPADCNGTLERLRMNPPVESRAIGYARQLAVDEDFLYVVESDRILRMRRGIAAGTFEPLYQAKGRVTDIALYADSMVWLENTADGSGRLLSCPKTGCEGAPKVLVDGLLGPTDLLVDDTYVYYLEPRCTDDLSCNGVPPDRDRLSRCARTDGASPTVLLENVGLGLRLNHGCSVAPVSMAMDDEFLYVPACDPALVPTQTDGSAPLVHGCGIAVVAK